MSRGNGKVAVFRNDAHRRSFLQTLAELAARLTGSFMSMTLGAVADRLADGDGRSLIAPFVLGSKIKPKEKARK
jgi:hypothetical protein